MTRKEHNIRMIIQRLAGIVMLVLSYVGYRACVTSVTPEDMTPIVIMTLVGLWFLISRKLILR